MTNLLDKLISGQLFPSHRDNILFIRLCVLNFASGYATIEGAKHIVDHEGIAVYFGIAIQTLLFLMLAGLIVQRAPYKI